MVRLFVIYLGTNKGKNLKQKNMTTATITNLVNNITDKKTVKNYGITEAFFFQGEFYITSDWDLTHEQSEIIENELKTKQHENK